MSSLPLSSSVVIDASMTNVKSTQKRNLSHLLEGIDIADIAQYIKDVTHKNNSDSVNLSESMSELAGHQPYRSGDTQPSTSGKGQGTAGKKSARHQKIGQVLPLSST